MTPSLEGLPTKAKEAPSPHEVRLAPLDTNPVFQSLGETYYLSLTTEIWSDKTLECASCCQKAIYPRYVFDPFDVNHGKQSQLFAMFAIFALDTLQWLNQTVLLTCLQTVQ